MVISERRGTVDKEDASQIAVLRKKSQDEVWGSAKALHSGAV